MADFEKTIAIIFEGDDRLGKTISSLSGGLDDLGSRAVSATQPFADLAESALKLEAAFAALVAGGLAYAVKTAGEFSDSFNEISTLFQATPADVDQFKQSIVDYSKDSVKSIDDINSAVYTAISAGIDYKDAIAALSESEKLSVAGKADLEATTRLLASTLNAYGESTDQASKYSDAFFQTVKLGQTKLPELADSMAHVTLLAANMRVPIETLTAAIAALTANGVPTTEAITQIRAALVAFAKPTSQASEVAEKLGIDFSATAVQTKGFETVLKEVYDATDGNVELMSRLFGRVEALNAALTLGRDESGKFADALAQMREAAGSTEEAFGKMSENISLVAQNLKNNLRATLIDFGTPLLDESVDIMQAISQVFQSVSFSFHSGAFDPIFNMIETFGASLAVDIKKIADALPEALESVDFSDFLESIEGLGGEIRNLFESFFGSIDLTTPEGLAIAIQKLVDGGTALTNVVKGILTAWEPFISAISAGIDKFSQSSADIQELVGKFLGWADVINTVAGKMDILTGALTSIGVGVNLLAITRIPALISSFTGLGGAVGLGGIAGGGIIAALLGMTAAIALIPDTKLREIAEQAIPGWSQMANAVDGAVLSLSGISLKSIETFEAQAKLTEQMGKAAVEAVREKEALDDLPENKFTSVEIQGTMQYWNALDGMLTQLQEIPETKETTVSAKADEQSLQSTKNTVFGYFTDEKTGEVIEIPVATVTDQASISKTKDDLATVPSEKQIDIILKGEIDKDIAQIKATAETLQSAFEWRAKVDIAEVEQVFETVRQISGDITAMFESSGNVITSLADALQGASASEYLDILNVLSREESNRQDLVAAELELAKKNIEYLDAKKARLESGQALVTINGAGLSPALQQVLEEIIQLTQTTATEQGLEFLIGT